MLDRKRLLARLAAESGHSPTVCADVLRVIEAVRREEIMELWREKLATGLPLALGRGILSEDL